MSSTLDLPQRSGTRPKTRSTTPHQQLDQIAPAALQEQLWQRMTSLDDVHTGPSTMSLPDTRALHLDPRAANGPPEAFVPGTTEFAPLHGSSDGSLHLALPEAEATAAIDKGWAEPHPVVRLGLAPPTLVMLGPRNEAELETIWRLVQASHAFASRLA
jgi:Luciferase